MPKCIITGGSMKITANRKEKKLSSKREDILDNTEPCQTKYGAASVVWTNNHGYLQAGKVALLNVIMITFSRYYYKLPQDYTLTGAAWHLLMIKGI